MSNISDDISTEDWYAFVEFTLSEEPYISQVIFSISMLIIFLFSLLGNILTCIVIYNDTTMHTATNYYLFNLAVSDLLVTFPILLVIYQILSHHTQVIQFNYGDIPCKFVHCIHIIFVYALWNNGILVMTALSIERYIAIYYPMMLKGTPEWKRVGRIIAVIWAVAVVETIPVIWTLDLIKTETSVTCFSVETATARMINRWLAVMTFVIPLIIIIFVYTMIAFKVNFNQRKNLQDTVFNYRDKKNKVNKLIAAFTLLTFWCLVALTVSFVICWLPFFLIRVVPYSADLHRYTQLRRWWAMAHKVAIFNAWFSTVLNPLLFSVMSTKFRKALRKLWDKRFKK